MPDPTPAEAAVRDGSGQFAEDGIAVTAAPRVSLQRAAAWVAPATFVANVLAYAFNLVLSRWLGPSDYGELGALLGLGLIAMVPALALQPVVARLLALAPAQEVAGLTRAALRSAAVVGGASAGVVLLALPLTTALLRVDPVLVVLLAATLAPAPVLTAAQGVLQGRERFKRLSLVFVVAAAARLLGAVVGAHLEGGVAGALAGSAVGAAVAAAVGVALVTAGRPGIRLPRTAGVELAGAAVALLGLLVLGNIDVLLARNRLPAHDAGLYAVGAVVAKAGFWAPQFVSVVVFARLAEGGRVLGRSVAVVGGVGVLLTGGCALLGSRLVELAFGDRYTDLGGSVWVFAATGSTLAVAQLLLYARMAAADRRLSAAVAAIVTAEIAVVLVIDAGTVRTIALVALAGAAMLALVAALLHRTSPAPAGVSGAGGVGAA